MGTYSYQALNKFLWGLMELNYLFILLFILSIFIVNLQFSSYFII